MAYTATVKLVRLGSMDFKIVVDETEVGTSSATVINRRRPNGEAEDQNEAASIPSKFRLLGIISTLRSGTGSTVAPKLDKGLGTGPETYTAVLEPTAAAQVSAMSAAPVYLTLEGGALRHTATPNAGADNSVRTEYLCRRGWADTDYDWKGEVLP